MIIGRRSSRAALRSSSMPKSITRPAEQRENIMELPTGNESMVCPCRFASQGRRFLSHSNWSHFIAPHRSYQSLKLEGVPGGGRGGSHLRGQTTSIANPAVPISYLEHFLRGWGQPKNLNLGPRRYESPALTVELQALVGNCRRDHNRLESLVGPEGFEPPTKGL